MAITPKTLYFQRLPGRDNSGDRRRTSLLPRDQRPADGFYQELIVHRRDFRHCCKVSDEAAFCLIQRPYISKTLLTRRISPRGSP
ncbi:TPA: hypothetical protein MIA59_26115 [Klebsiella pneumoniae]|nr:hypothetical protein EJ362_27470 [Klebsiella pneumoniae]RVX48476.1 hypothetical protein EJ360_27625 [Klebsiella pneumoniae]HBX6791496.1 hypothetical protein [Klebsiella pneumoniae]